MEYLIVIPILLTIATLLNIYVMLKVARQEKELEKKITDLENIVKEYNNENII